MKEIPSRQFRTTYQRLTEPVTVTANGHVIGTYFPNVFPVGDVEERVIARFDLADHSPKRADVPPHFTVESDRFGSSRPAPKPGKR